MEEAAFFERGMKKILPDGVTLLKLYKLERSSKFSSYKIELRNRVTQNDVTLLVTNSKIFIEILLSSYELDCKKY